MSDWLEVVELNGTAGLAAPLEPEIDVVFVHGLGSDSRDAWTAANKHYWPQELADSDASLRVWTVGYPAKAVEWFGSGGDQPELEALSLEFLLKLKDAGLGCRPSVWVAHSLGGLLSKLILMKSAEREATAADEFRHDSVVGLLFLATPHGGAALANVLSFSLKTAVPLFGQALVAAIGLPGLAGWLVEKGFGQSCTSTQLIDYLKTNDDGRDTDRARFNTYFGERHRSQRPLEVRVYREEVPKKIAGAPTVMVVDRASSDPKLFYSIHASVPVLGAPGLDHSTICKPEGLRDPIADTLLAMVKRARRREFVFALGDAEHDRVAALAFRLLTGSDELLAWLSEKANGEAREVAAKWARLLVGGDGAAAAIGLDTLTQRLTDGSARLHANDLDSIRGLGGSLAVLAFGSFAACLVPQPLPDDGPAFALPELGSADDPISRTYIELLSEVLQAHRSGRVARFVIQQTESDSPEPAGASPRLVANSVSDPASMREEDHLSDLRGQIREIALRPGVRQLALGSISGANPANLLLRRAERARAQEHLRALDARREGLWIDARAPGNAYQQPELRRTVHAEFARLLPFALQADAAAETTDDQAAALGRMVSQLTDFAINFERAKRGMSTP